MLTVHADKTRIGYTLCVLVLIPTWGCGSTDTIRRDEEVTFYPTAAYRSADGNEWVVPIHGRVCAPTSSSIERMAAMAVLGLALDAGDLKSRSAMIQRRLDPFVAESMPGRKIPIRIGGQEIHGGSSAQTGHFTGKVNLADVEIRSLKSNKRSGPPQLAYTGLTSAADSRKFKGEVFLVEPTGVSVISDIDDTVKITEVTDKYLALKNTFMRKYRPVPGMPEVYQEWAKAGCQFHYVSASPWQLYRDISQCFDESGLPQGSYHLQKFDWKVDDFKNMFVSPGKNKSKTISELLKTYPQRKFILVGDSGQEDPEIYGEVTRSHGEQVEHIFIRELGNDNAQSKRYQDAFEKIPAEKWTVFRDPSEIRGVPPRSVHN